MRETLRRPPGAVALRGPQGADRCYLWFMDWHKYITSNPKVLDGKPTVKGTRLSVEFILGLMANGWTEAALLENYERLRAVHIRAIYGFISENIAAGRYPQPLGGLK